MRPLLLALLFAFLVPAHADCPLGANQTQLTFDQVMLNFSNYLNAPDLTAQNGFSDPSSVLISDVQKATKNIGITIDCANDVLNNSTGSLYPPEYYEQNGAAAQAAYLNLLYSYMTEFEQALQTYQSLYSQLATEPVESWDFTAVENQSQTVDAIATDAHGDLQ